MEADHKIVQGNSASAVEHTVDLIKDLIRARSLGVGDLLPTEKELAAMFGTGRNSVREAIRILKAYGVVESRQKFGTVITDRRWDAMLDIFSFGFDISAERFIDIQGYRRVIEINAFDLIQKHVSDTILSDLKQINEELRNAEIDRACDLDFKFHKTLIDAAGNQTMADVYHILKPIIMRLMLIGKESRPAVDGTYFEHLAIIAALEEGDGIAYAYHMSNHLKAGLRFVSAKPQPDKL